MTTFLSDVKTTEMKTSTVSMFSFTDCCGWTFQDVGLSGNPADGCVYIQHFDFCGCPKGTSLADIIPRLEELVAQGVIDEREIGKCILLTKLGFLREINGRPLEKSMPRSYEADDGIVLHEPAGKFNLIEAEEASHDVWDAILLPVKGKEYDDISPDTGELDQASARDIKEGDLVYIRGRCLNGAMRTKQMPRHLEDQVLGPFEVLRAFRNSCYLDIPKHCGIFPIVHKIFLERSQDRGSSGLSSQM
ncbi:hypothetical protein F5Y15DRAFT_125803 [Xylariaceae sp. FL0016]|nr:hypothetical protein F5Y15DRAFT_125803 [Xylariaceae sp. FL0016]